MSSVPVHQPASRQRLDGLYAEESSVEGWDLTTGSTVWRWDADANQVGNGGPRIYGSPTSPPVVVNGFVLFGSGQNSYALDGRTGRQVWSGALGVFNPVFLASAGEGLLALAGTGAVTVYGTGGNVNPPAPTAADEAVSHKIDVAHTGSQGGDSLTARWRSGGRWTWAAW